MKLLLNCDQVFDVLTRGPFPTGDASDEPVEHHLRACHECRRLAEALRPAVELMHESLGPDAAVDLPEYQGVLAAVEHSVATDQIQKPTPLAVRKLPRRAAPSRRKFDAAQFFGALRLIAAVVLVTAIGTLLWGLATTSKDGAPRREIAAAGPRPASTRLPIRFDDRSMVLLSSLNLPPGCIPDEPFVLPNQGESPPSPTAAAAKTKTQCCSQCHLAGKSQAELERLSAHDVAVLSRSCVACHSL